MAQQGKKKRADPEPPPPDAGQKPVQLQRRRKIDPPGARRSNATVVSPPAPNAQLQALSVPGSRQRTEELEARLIHMETIFTQLAPVLEQIPTNGAGPSTSPANATAALSPEATAMLRSVAPRDGHDKSPSSSPKPVKVEDDVSESFGQLALDEYGHPRWIGGSSTMSLIQSFRAITSSPLHRISPMEEDPLSPIPSVNKLYFPASVFFGKVRALPGPEEVEYPPRDLADKLVNAYFARFHFLMPILDKPKFLREYEHVMNNQKDRELHRSQTAFISLIFAVFTCAANLVQDDRLNVTDRADEGGMGMVYYERLSVTPIEKETRRKIWAGVYTLDRMLAIALGRPLGIEDADCDVEEPVEVDDESLPEYFSGANMPTDRIHLMTGFNSLTKLYEIGGRVLRQVYGLDNCKEQLEPERQAELQQTVEALDAELTQWCDDLLPVFKSQPQTDEQVSMGAVLCSHYYSVLTTLHRNFIPVKRSDQLVTPKSTAKAVSSARSCIRLAPSMKNVVPPSHHLAFFIQHLFSSAVILLLYAMHTPDTRAARAAMDEAKTSLDALQSWEGQWPGARKCRELLVDLTNTANEAIARHASESPSIPPSTAAPADLEHRAPGGASASAMHSRVTKNRSTRRTESRDRAAPSRRMAAVSPYRHDNARARSSSRRRGHESHDSIDGPYFHSLSSPTTTLPQLPNPGSAHSSPASAHLPSPITTVNESGPEASPTLLSAHAFSTNHGSPELAFNQVPSPPRYENDFGIQTNPLQYSSAQQWNGQSELYSPTSAEGSMPFSNANDSGFSESYNFGMSGDMNEFLGSLSTSPPTTSFAATGLPFRGLDYLRNYPDGNPVGDHFMGEQDPLWHSYDPVSFELNPDLPFTLGDRDLHNGLR
ncbi:hypothetical protein V5O48_001235 [Marasmius crinis-equi]|uniref:Xylanolytic transcriptional activator regulatory domain-containing protein n=1 Tax=Marasmius crinis-equi TaxID=585013 RepID=A0ABR3FYZ4_9AGAR